MVPRGSSASYDDRPVRPGAQVTVVQVVASSAATICAALTASRLGVAGTVVGAGVMSLVATVGSALYSRWLYRGTDLLREAGRSPRVPRPALPRLSVRGAVGLALAPLLVFAIGIGGLTAAELLRGQSVAAASGGSGASARTTLGAAVESVTPAGSADEPTPVPTGSPTRSPSSSASPTASPTPSARLSPSRSPSPSPSTSRSPSTRPSVDPSPPPSSAEPAAASPEPQPTPS